MKCPHCGKSINPAALLGGIKSEKKAKSSRENGKKGGRPKKTPTKEELSGSQEQYMPYPIKLCYALSRLQKRESCQRRLSV